MADYIYRSDGSPAGFRLGEHIFAMDGLPVGRVFAEKAYTLEGQYVGAIVNNMVLDKPGISRHRLRRFSPPEKAAPAKDAGRRMPVHEIFDDCFHLLEESDEAARASASA